MKRRTFPFFLCLLFLLVLVLVTGFLFALFFSPPAARVEAPALLALDEGWARQLLDCTDKSDRLDFLDAVPDQAEAWGCQGVLIRGRYGEDGFFEDKTDTLTLAPALDGTDPVSRLKTRCAKAGIALYLLVTDEEGTPLSREDAPDWALKLAEKSSPVVLFAGQAEGFSTTLKGATAYTDGEELTLLDGVSPASLAALQQAGTGGVLGSWNDLEQDASPARLLASFRQAPEETLPDTSLPRQAAICYPSDGFSTYYDTLCLTGTSDPASEVLLNGQPVDRPGSQGVWTKAVTLALGENTFTLTQGDVSQTVTVTYKTPPEWTPAQPESDGSVEAQPGQWLRVTADGIASLLADYQDSSTILATIPQGAMARVADSAQYTTSSKITWAYQLENGGWLRASDVELLGQEDPAAALPAFTGLSVLSAQEGDLWTLEGTGTPLYLEERGEDGSLSLTFPDASFEGEVPQGGEFAASVSLEQNESEEEGEEAAGFTLRFTFDEENPLWGYTVRYAQEGVQIFLKRAPRLSDDPAAPLDGVRVLLDAGHGGEDNGASGCAGTTGPLEKDLNMALALAAKARLEQLGATVNLTRQGDDTLTLAQRLDAVNRQAPDFFLSLHHNSIALTRDTLDVNGTECYWFTPQSEELAAALTSRFAAAFGCNDRGAREDYYFVTRTTACPAVLLESGFVTTALEYERCADETGLWAEGGAVAEAVLSTLAG